MKYRKMMLGALVAVMLAFCGHLDTYTETVAATENTITATDRDGNTYPLPIGPYETLQRVREALEYHYN